MLCSKLANRIATRCWLLGPAFEHRGWGRGGRTFLDTSRPTPKPIQRRVKLGESGSGVELKKHPLLAPGLSMGRPIHIPTLCALLGCYGKALKYTLSFSHKIVALRYIV